jgi:hypothetical protein
MKKATKMPFRAFILVLFGSAALISVGWAVSNAIQMSGDFQWSPTVLLLDGQNPYEVFLEGNPNNAIIKIQYPNYAHGLYVALMPFGMMDWETAKIAWAAFNVAAGALIILLLSRAYALTLTQTTLVAITFLLSAPFRNAVASGQQSLMMLLAFSALLLSSRHWSSFTGGFGYFKYSFAPPFAAYLLFRRGKTHLLASLVPGLIGFVVFWSITGGPFVVTLVQPLAVSSQTMHPGMADLMTIVESVTQYGSLEYLIGYYGLPIVVSLVGAYAAAFHLRHADLSFAFLCVISLITFKHLSYDFIFLLPAFVVGVKHSGKYASKYVLLVTVFVWFGWKAIQETTDRVELLEWASVFMSPFANFLLLLSMALAILFVASDPCQTQRDGVHQ